MNAEEYFHMLGKSLEHSKPGNMFGWRCYKVGRKPFVFFDENTADGMVFKLKKPDIEYAILNYDAQIFNPGDKGKPMTNWVVINYHFNPIWEELLHLSYNYVLEELKDGK